VTATRAAAAFLAGVLLLAGCSAPLAPDEKPSPRAEASSFPTASPSRTPQAPTPEPDVDVARAKAREARAKALAKAQRAARAAQKSLGPVIAISVDALNPTALTRLGPSRLPEFHALIRAGASTLNARTELESTETLPNHTGMLTGRPVGGPNGHGVAFNKDPGQVTVSSHAGHPVGSVFDVVHRAGGTTALYASKTKFALYQRSWAGSLDRTVIDQDNDRLVSRLVADLASHPSDFSFVHLSAPDVAGHASGFMGPAYLRAVERVDRLLGRIRDAVAASPGLRTRAHLIVTADHGGRGTHGHSAAAKPDDYRVPFVVDGPTARAGSDLYALNPDYRDPGAGRPSYDGRQPVRNGDLADLATRLLGLPPVPGSVFGTHDQLDVR
jgi:hypothetical protein